MIFIKQFIFHLPQRHGQIHVGPVRIFQTERFLPKCCELFFAVFLDVHNLWRVVDTLAVLKHRNHQLADGVAVRGQMGLFPGFNRVEEQQGFAGIVLFVYQADQVCDDLASFLIIDPTDGLVARVGDLLGVLGEFDLRDEFTGLFIQDGSQLVDTAEGRAILGGDQVSANAPGVDGCTL